MISCPKYNRNQLPILVFHTNIKIRTYFIRWDHITVLQPAGPHLRILHANTLVQHRAFTSLRGSSHCCWPVTFLCTTCAYKSVVREPACVLPSGLVSGLDSRGTFCKRAPGSEGWTHSRFSPHPTSPLKKDNLPVCDKKWPS